VIFAWYGVGFVSDTMSYVVRRVRWCNTIFFNARASTEKKGDDSKTVLRGTGTVFRSHS